MKIFRQIFVFLICLSYLASCASQNKSELSKVDKKKLIARLNDSVFCISVVVKSRESEKRFSVGTGFLVSENLIASAAHVQTKAKELFGKFAKPDTQIVAWKRFAGGEIAQFPVQVAASDEKGDLLIYKFDQKVLQENQRLTTIKPLVLAENLPTLGEEVLSIGYYGAYDMPFNSLGAVSMIDTNDDIISDLTLMPGNSGAPVCSLETGEVLGVTTEVLDLGNETVRFGIARRATKLRELLRKL